MADRTSPLITIVRCAVLISLAAHLLVLFLGEFDAVSSPISQLSRGKSGWIHSLGLLSLAASWVILAYCHWHRDSGWLWRGAWVLILFSVPLLLFVAYYFATASDSQLFGPDANDPLAVLASVLGVAMGGLQLGLRRQRPGLALINVLILVLWIGLVPVIPFIEAGWLGAYERTVGGLMLVWTLALSALPEPASGH